MKNLYVFGCSFTHGNGCFPTEPYYIEYKKSNDDMIWPEILSKHYDMTLHNISLGGESNDKILDRVMGAFDSITEGDMVFIQMTFHHRYDLPNKEHTEFYTVAPSSGNILSPEYSEEEISHINYMSTLYSSRMFENRHVKRFEFLKNQLIEKKIRICILWDLYPDYHGKIETIRDATRDTIWDFHWSYKGHRDFANKMIKLVENEENNNRW